MPKTPKSRGTLFTLMLLSIGACQPAAVKKDTGLASGTEKNPCAYDVTGKTSLDLSDIQRAYACAVKDASKAEKGEISSSLHPVSSTGSVLVAHWARLPPANANDAFQVGGRFRPDWDIWVTLVPEVQEFCTRLPAEFREPGKLALRLEQLLGLPPNNGKMRMVQMRVEASALFRPCPDPDITDSQCELDYPSAVSAEHRGWLDKLRSTTYSPPKPYPFTALGYTYDWGNPASPVGLSEYVIKQGSEVVVESVTPTEEYCARTRDQDPPRP